LARKGWNR